MDAPQKLVEVMRALKVGSSVSLKVFHDGRERELEYSLPERPLLPGDIAGQRMLTPMTRKSIQPAAPPSQPFPKR
jgi:hypothetical protein